MGTFFTAMGLGPAMPLWEWGSPVESLASRDAVPSTSSGGTPEHCAQVCRPGTVNQVRGARGQPREGLSWWSRWTGWADGQDLHSQCPSRFPNVVGLGSNPRCAPYQWGALHKFRFLRGLSFLL